MITNALLSTLVLLHAILHMPCIIINVSHYSFNCSSTYFFDRVIGKGQLEFQLVFQPKWRQRGNVKNDLLNLMLKGHVMPSKVVCM